MISAHSEEARQYIKDHVTPIIEQLLTDLVVKRPNDVVQFCQLWFRDYEKGTHPKPPQHVESESDDELVSAQILAKTKTEKYKRRRQAITTEVYGRYCRAEQIKPEFHKKSEETKTRILIRLKDSFMFRSLDDQQTNTLIDAMPEQTLEAGDVLINENDQIDKMFVVDRGELEAYSSEQGERRISKQYFPSDSFGEIGLLYSHRIAYSVRAKKASVVYSLDRQTFSSVNRLSVKQKRELLMTTLPKMYLFREMDAHEIDQLADTVKELCAYSNEYVVKEGEHCHQVFIVSRGRLSAEKTAPKDEQPEQTVQYYTESSYFGVECLTSEEPAKTSIVSLVPPFQLTQTNSKLLCIDRQSIIRIVGPIARILQRTTAPYNSHSSYGTIRQR